MDDNALIARIIERQGKLKKVGDELKEYFVGLDLVIDKILTSIEAWYCMPELLTRPTIVCLWGLTGNGKTDLVRRLVMAMDFTDSFVEIQMTNKGSSSNTQATTLNGLLGSSNVAPEEPGILLLDEIQRFRAVDSEGKDIHDYHFQDLWMLLSDGSFGSASDNKQHVIELLLEAVYWEDYQRAQNEAAAKKKKEEADDEEVEEAKQESDVESRRQFKQTYYQSRQLKKRLRLPEPIEEIMRWNASKKLEILTQKLHDKSIYNPEIYSKLLIFVSGNLDEAYKMADQTDETDVDADLFHKHSLRINLLTIKRALTTRFKPEQIARFGNTHVIYPALSRSSYEEIIRRKVEGVLQKVESTSGVRIEPDKSVYDAIYRNGVFPVQGTRPVFSTISSFFESAIPTFTLKSLQTGVSLVKLSYEKQHLVSWIDGQLVKLKNEGDIDRIRKSKRNEEQIRKVSIHEAGHAIVYAKLFGFVPTQVAVVVASDDKNGFVGLHAIDPTRQTLLDQITVLLAGRMGEEVVFGKNNVNAGASGDIERATGLAAGYVRLYGMGATMSRLSTTGHPNSINFNLDLKASNVEIEAILQAQKKESEKLVRENIALIKEMADYLIVNEKIEYKNFIEICQHHDLKVQYLDAKETVYPKYKNLYDGHFTAKEVN
jgi:cell division protease FtsH